MSGVPVSTEGTDGDPHVQRDQEQRNDPKKWWIDHCVSPEIARLIFWNSNTSNYSKFPAKIVSSPATSSVMPSNHAFVGAPDGPFSTATNVTAIELV